MLLRNIVFLSVVGLARCAGDVITVEENAKPLLATSPLIRQFGTSEFRLTANDYYDRPFCFSPNGKLLAGSNGRELRIWSFPDGKLLHDLSKSVETTCISFASQGREFLALDRYEKAIHRFDVTNGTLISTTLLKDLMKEKTLTHHRFSHDGRWLCTYGRHRFLTAWETSSGKRMFRIEMERMSEPHGVNISDEGVITLSNGVYVDRYDVTTGNRLARFRISGKLRSVISNSQGTLWAAHSVNDKAIVFYQPETDQLVGGQIPAESREWPLDQAALSDDGRRLSYWVPNGEWEYDRKMAVFDVATGKLITSFEAPDVYFFYRPVISPDGQYVFPSAQRSVFRPVDTATGEVYRPTADHVLEVHALAFTPDSKTLIVGSHEKYQAWDVASGKAGAVYERWFDYDPFVAAIDNERVLVSGMRKRGMRLHDLHSGAILKEYNDDETSFIRSFQLADDRQSYSVLMRDRETQWVRRTDIRTGETLGEWRVPQEEKGRGSGTLENRYHRYAFQELALGGSRLIRFEKVRPAKQLSLGIIDWGQIDVLLEDWTTQTITNRFALPADGRCHFADAGNGRHFAAVVTDSHYPDETRGIGWGSTHLVAWDIKTNTEILHVKRERKEYFTAFTAVAISPDGKLAATASHRDRIEIWDVQTGKLLQRFDGKNDVVVLAFNENGSLLASGHRDGRVLLWNATQALGHASR